MWIAVGALCAISTLAAAQQLTLHDAVQRALRTPQAQAVSGQVDVARGQLRQAGLGPNPRLFLQSEDIRPWDQGFSFPTQTEDYGFVAQTFETDGKRRRRVDLAGARLEQVRAQAQLAQAQIAGRVAAAYWNAAVMGRTVTLLEQDMHAVDEMVRYHQERVSAGAMRGVDLLRIQIERDRLLITLRSAERDAEQARLELQRQMGEPATGKVEAQDPIEQVINLPPVPVETVLSQRADVQAARRAVDAAVADVGLQKANGVPDFDLVGGYKRNSGQDTAYTSLQVPLPFRNRNQGEIERAKAEVTVAKANLAAVELRVRAEVLESEQNLKREQDIVERELPDMRQKAAENLRLMTEAYRLGGVDLLRYLDAERTAFDVEVSALRTWAEYQQAVLRVQLSYGVQP